MSFSGLLKRYYITAIMVSIFLLVYILHFISTAYSIANPNEDAPFPPWISPCPDYWSNVSTGGKTLCLQSQNNGPSSYVPTGNVSTNLAYDFTNSGQQPLDFSDVSLQQKCEWSKDSGVFWEGISDKACSSFAV